LRLNNERNKLGFFAALAFGLGAMIGAGIFVLSGYAAGTAGPAGAVSFLIAGICAMFTALSSAELASALPQAGGPYVFVKEGLGEALGFVTGWSVWVGLSLACAFYAMGFGQYLMFFLPGCSSKLTGALLLVLMLAINLAGAKRSATVQNMAVALLLIILLVYITVGLSDLDTQLHKPFAPYGWTPVVQTASVVFVSFLGFELLPAAAGDIRNARTVLPLLTVLSVTIVTILYVLVVYVATGILSYVDLGQSARPIADSAFIVIGRNGAIMIITGGLLATLSSANAAILAGARIAYAMSKDLLLPRHLAITRPSTNTPVNAVILTVLLSLLATGKGDTVVLAQAASFLHLFPFLLVNAAVVVLRRTSTYKPGFRLPFGILIPLLGLGSSVMLLVQITATDLFLSFLLIMPGLLYYLANRRVKLVWV